MLPIMKQMYNTLSQLRCHTRCRLAAARVDAVYRRDVAHLAAVIGVLGVGVVAIKGVVLMADQLLECRRVTVCASPFTVIDWASQHWALDW